MEDGVAYQSLVFEGVVDTSEKQPERPEVLEAKFENEVGHENDRPHH